MYHKPIEFANALFFTACRLLTLQTALLSPGRYVSLVAVPRSWVAIGHHAQAPNRHIVDYGLLSMFTCEWSRLIFCCWLPGLYTAMQTRTTLLLTHRWYALNSTQPTWITGITPSIDTSVEVNMLGFSVFIPSPTRNPVFELNIEAVFTAIQRKHVNLPPLHLS